MKKIILVGLSLAMCASAWEPGFDPEAFCDSSCGSLQFSGYHNLLGDCEMTGEANVCRRMAVVKETRYEPCMERCVRGYQEQPYQE